MKTDDASENVADWSYNKLLRVSTIQLVEAFVMGGSQQVEVRLRSVFYMYREWHEAYATKLKEEEKSKKK
jgi:hypothetical protein